MCGDIFHFSVCFHSVERKHLNGRGSGCNTHRTPVPRGVLNAFASDARTRKVK